MEYLINAQVNNDKLHVELEEVFGDLFLGIFDSGSQKTAVFDGELSGAQEILFSAVLADHDYIVHGYRIYDYVPDTLDRTIFPGSINFNTGLTTRLHPKHNIVKGELQETTYYAEYDGVSYATPILKVSFVWFRDPSGFVLRRDSSVAYYLDNGALAQQTKDMQKFYNEQESIDEGRRRRRNIVNDINLTVVGLMKMTMPEKTDAEVLQMGSDWYAANKDAIDNFVDTSDQKIRSDILIDTTPWMDNTIPDFGGASIRQIIYQRSEV